MWTMNSWISWILNNLILTFQVRPYESYKYLNVSKFNLIIYLIAILSYFASKCRGCFSCTAVTTVKLHGWSWLEATCQRAFGSAFFWDGGARGPLGKRHKECAYHPQYDIIYVKTTSWSWYFPWHPWTCFFNFETVYICECHIHKFKTRQFGKCFHQ